jgi:hypothetical protein
LAIVGLVGCGNSPHSSGSTDERTEQTESALTGGDVLGFESTGGWAVSSGNVSLTTTHTQGTSALAVTAPVNYTTLVSVPLSSSLAGLAALTDQGSTVSVDLELPTSQPNQFYFGALQLYVSSPSRGVFNQYLGQAALTGQPLGVFQTYQFSVTPFVRSQLAQGAFSDLTFTLALNAPAGAKGTYIFDNLRTTSPAKAPVGAGPSIDLTAIFTPGSPTSPGVAQFTSGTIQVPSGFHVKLGDAGTGTALLELGFGSTTSVACKYNASSDATAYNFASCNTANVAGDIVAASFARLTIQSADANAPETKIKAQLAYNALGDLVGTKLMPAIPTFWGETTTDVNAIITNFFDSEETFKFPGQMFGTLPIPDFAQETSDGSPVDFSMGPPPVGDPVFNKQGHLHQGGPFDAFWLLQGNFDANGKNDDFTTTLNATAAIHGVIFGKDITVADVEVTSNTDTGTLTAGGFVNSSASATVKAHIFGQEVTNNSLNGPGSLNIFPPVNVQQTFPVFDFNIWIVDVQVSMGGALGLTTVGNLATNGPSIVVTPTLSAIATASASINVVLASASVTGTIQLLNVSIPITASALWQVSTDPAICAGTLDFDVNGHIQLSTLGGSVKLQASLGPCPFCISHTWTLVSWNPIKFFDKVIFDINTPGQTVGLTKSLCIVPLDVIITNPVAPATGFAGVPQPVSASATRPGSEGTSGPQPPTPVPCQDITWTSSDPGAVFTPPTGCSSSVTFSAAAVGTQPTITATATDQFGETGFASLPVSVQLAASGPVLKLTSPSDGQPATIILNQGNTFTATMTVTEVEPAGAPTQDIIVTCTQSDGPNTAPWGTPQTIVDSAGGTSTFNVSVADTPAFGINSITITCIATDASNNTSSDTGSLQVVFLQ